jgi:hypothetical protein
VSFVFPVRLTDGEEVRVMQRSKTLDGVEFVKLQALEKEVGCSLVALEPEKLASISEEDSVPIVVEIKQIPFIWPNLLRA